MATKITQNNLKIFRKKTSLRAESLSGMIFCLFTFFISFYFQIIFIPSSFATWEIAVVFLGAQENAEYQKDIDRNILELAKIKLTSTSSPSPDLIGGSTGGSTPNDIIDSRLARQEDLRSSNSSEPRRGNDIFGVKLSIYREFSERSVSYFVDPSSKTLSAWDSLFYEISPSGIQIPGELEVSKRNEKDPSLLLDNDKLSWFLKKSFSTPNAQRMLIIYTHGFGFKGLKHIKLKKLKTQLETFLPKRSQKALDILWLDACFMATIEVAYELRNISSLFMASEESEFSAGMPFDILEELNTEIKDPVFLAKILAERFLESYSFIQEGTQRRYVYTSPATISLIDLNHLEPLITEISGFVKSFDKKRKISTSAFRMSQEDLMDLGNIFLQLNYKPVLHLLHLTQFRDIKTNLRILVKPKRENSFLVYGYEQWQRGFETDSETLNKLPPNLTPSVFVKGPKEKKWPARLVNKQLYITPFSPGLNTFHFFFADPKNYVPLEEAKTFSRTQDIVTFDSVDSPVLFSGYTQSIGKWSERYTGLSILNIFENSADLDYLDTDFNQKTNWASLGLH